MWLLFSEQQTGLGLVALLPQLLTCWNQGSVVSWEGTVCLLNFYYAHTTQFTLLACEGPRKSCLSPQTALHSPHSALISSQSVTDALLCPRQHSFSVSVDSSILTFHINRIIVFSVSYFDPSICLEGPAMWRQGLLLHFYYQVIPILHCISLVTGGPTSCVYGQCIILFEKC